MPELPEVETVRRGLVPAMEGKRILSVQTRRKVVGELSTGEALIMHLGMTGRFTVSAKKAAGKPGRFHRDVPEDEKHDHVVFDMQGGARITFNDARRFGFMDLWPADDLDRYPAFVGLGPEPISNEFSGAYLAEAFRGKKTPVKAALLDQHVVAGLGNIYVCEALFRSGVNPKKLAGAIKRDRLEPLAVEIRKVIEEAIQAGGSTISDFATTDGDLGYFQHRFQIYDREGDPCLVCRKPVKRLVQSGRSTFYCSTCQK
jgi:formamidopyrimidine-DNA glycosylase